MSRLLAFVVAALAVVVVGCSSDSTPTTVATPAPEKLTFVAGFKPQANLPFVGVYVAQAKGFFAEEGLDVEIRHSTPGTNEAVQQLLAGQAQVSTANVSSVLKQRAEGAPTVSIALIGQLGEQGLVALADSGIKTPKDFEGKTVGYRTFPSPEYISMLEKEGVDRSKIEEVNLESPDVRLLTEGTVDVLPAFLSNEPFKLKQLGKDVVTFNPADYGVASYGLAYITTEDALANRQGALAKFLRAALRGIEYARQHPDEAIQITLTYATGEDPAAQRFILDSELAHSQNDLTNANGTGWQTADQWNASYTLFRENGGLDKDVDTSKAWTDALLKAVYKDGVLTGP